MTKPQTKCICPTCGTPHRELPDPAIAFWQKVQRASGNGCWLWQGTIHVTGYGHFDYRGLGMNAHRWAYLLTYGEIPEGILVCHKCDVRACVRPSHLFLGTQKDNIQDAMQKGRLAAQLIALSSENRRKRISPLSGLSMDDVRRVRQRVSGGESMRAVARDYCVTPRTIRLMVERKTWAWVE